jgi:hypothetical protein
MMSRPMPEFQIADIAAAHEEALWERRRGPRAAQPQLAVGEQALLRRASRR